MNANIREFGGGARSMALPALRLNQRFPLPSILIARRNAHRREIVPG